MTIDFARLEVLQRHKTVKAEGMKELLTRLKKAGTLTDHVAATPQRTWTEEDATLSLSDLEHIAVACESVLNLQLVCCLNASQAALKISSYRLALKFATRALLLDDTSIKARYRSALALRGLKQHEDALKLLEETVKMKDGNTALVQGAIRDLRTTLAKRSRPSKE